MSLVDRVAPSASVAGPRSEPAPRKARPRSPNNRPSPYERACAYVAAMPGGIQGSGGSRDTMRAAVAAARGFELSEDNTFIVLRDRHNPKCEPAWSDKELAHKAKSAFDSDRVELGYLLNDTDNGAGSEAHGGHGGDDGWRERSPADDSAGEDSDEPPAYTVSGDDRAPVEGPTANDPLRGLKHLAAVALVGRARIEALASTPVSYVWQDIAVAGTIVLIAGPPAEGKTTLLFLILAARLNPGEVVTLLRRPIQPAPPGTWVVLIEGEHSECSTARKLVKSLDLLGLDHAALDRVIIVARKAVLLGSPQWLDVVMLASAGLVSDIAIDTVARVAPADPNDEREQVAVFDSIARAIEAAPDGELKPLVWAVAHTRKNTNDDLSDVSGSAQRTGQADSVLMIKGEKVDGRTVSTTVTFRKLREDPDEYPMPVTYAITPAGIEIQDGGTEGKAADQRPLEARIIDYLSAGPKTKTALSKLAQRSREDVDAALSNLFSAREIATIEITVGGRKRKAFTVTRRAPDGAPDPDHHRTSTARAPDGTE